MKKYMADLKHIDFMQKQLLVRTIPMVLVVLVLLALAIRINQPAEDEVATQASQVPYARAQVTAVLEDNAQHDYDTAEGRRVGSQVLELKILSGDHKNEIMTTTNYLSALYNVDAKQGDQLIVRILTDEDGTYYASVYNYNRGLVMGAFLLLFFLLLGILGGRKGIGALLGLLFTLACIWFILIPCIIRGWPAILMTILITGLSTGAS